MYVKLTVDVYTCKILQVRADTMYNKTKLADGSITAGMWSDPIYINNSQLPTTIPTTTDDDSDFPTFAYYIIGFGLGILCLVIILIIVCTMCRNMRDRWYDKSEIVSTQYLNHSTLPLPIFCCREKQYVQLIYP